MDLKKWPTEVGPQGEILSFVYKDLKVFGFLSIAVHDCIAPGAYSIRFITIQVSLVRKNSGRTVIPCTCLEDLVDYRPDSERLEQKTAAKSASKCTSET